MATHPSIPASAPEASILGQLAGEYRLRRKLGEGGYGAVYEAEHPVLGRRAAVKVLHRSAGSNADSVRRFIAEAQAASHIRSRHIVDIFSFGTLPDGRHFYVMDLLEGEALDRFIVREKRLDVVPALQLLRPIAAALDAAHAAGIVHRDLKPQNIFLVWEPNGEVVPKLLDFGTAKLLGQSPVHTMSGTVIGTPLYMSPEQALGQAVDGRADVYALGLLCHELLTGHPPITGASALGVLAAHLTQKPQPVSELRPDLGRELDQPILRMLAKDPSERPSTAGDALSELVKAAELAGYVISPEMPQLAAPPPLSKGSQDALNASSSVFPNAPWAEERSSERGLERDTLARSTDTVAARRMAWAVFAALSAVGVGATYLVANTSAVPPQPSAIASASAGDPARAGSERARLAADSAGSTALAGSAASTVAATDHDASQMSSIVEVAVMGAPRGARVLLHGKPLGEAPGPVAVPFGTAPLVLTITAAGYEPSRVSVVPNQSASVTVQLRKRSSGPTSSPGDFPSDLENPF